jgi:hypothetical protein
MPLNQTKAAKERIGRLQNARSPVMIEWLS